MKNLLNKEFKLSMHPMVPIMLCLSFMVIIPNYPYTVIFFYTTLAVFFTCLTGRENNDIVYSLMLPIAKKDIVKARMTFVVIQEIVQLIITIPFLFLSAKLNPTGNQAGMDANIALIGIGFIIYGVFNLVFLTQYYKNVNKVGKSFVIASIALFVLVFLDIISTYTIPIIRDYIDTVGLQYLSYKLIVLAIGIVVFVILTSLSYRKSVRLFIKQDL